MGILYCRSFGSTTSSSIVRVALECFFIYIKKLFAHTTSIYLNVSSNCQISFPSKNFFLTFFFQCVFKLYLHCHPKAIFPNATSQLLNFPHWHLLKSVLLKPQRSAPAHPSHSVRSCCSLRRGPQKA